MKRCSVCLSDSCWRYHNFLSSTEFEKISKADTTHVESTQNLPVTVDSNCGYNSINEGGDASNTLQCQNGITTEKNPCITASRTSNTENIVEHKEKVTAATSDHSYTSNRKRVRETTDHEYCDHHGEIDEEESDDDFNDTKSNTIAKMKAMLPDIEKTSDYYSNSILKAMTLNDITTTNFFIPIMEEMKIRCPELLQTMANAAIGSSTKTITIRQLTSIVTAYCILMFARCNKNSAFQRMVTILAVKGSISDECIRQLNQLSITLSCTQKLYILDKAVETTEKCTVEAIRDNPRVKITGDNLDMYIRTNHQRVDNDNLDIHWFASNMIFSRVNYSMLSIQKPKVNINQIKATSFLPNESEKTHLTEVKKALIGRMLIEKDEYQWLKGLIPVHIKHRFSEDMAKISQIYSLPVFFKNESKNEDCLDILKQYEKHLIKIFRDAHGNIDELNTNKVVLGGDQLTRERLQNMKNVCHLANTPEGRFEHLHPIVCELWHVKQDLLTKAYKALFNQDQIELKGSLYHAKIVLRRNDVNGNVKSNYKAHEDLLLVVLKALIFHVVETITNAQELGRDKLLHQTLRIIYGEQYDDNDEQLNYFVNLVTWAIQILIMNDTAKEGDLERMVINMKENVPFFYGHSIHSKYFSECVNTILQSEYLLSPQERVRMLEGAFVNISGRPGKNKEADLVQENCIKNKKELIRSLGANKTEKAVQRACMAADTCFAMSENINRQIGICRLSGRHTKKSSSKDVELLKKIFTELKPFTYMKDRKVKFGKLVKDPRQKVKPCDLLEAIRKKATSLFMYQ